MTRQARSHGERNLPSLQAAGRQKNSRKQEGTQLARALQSWSPSGLETTSGLLGLSFSQAITPRSPFYTARA